MSVPTPLLPAWAAVCAAHPRLRRDWRERVGLDVAPVVPGVVWIHASSVGEVSAAAALLPHFDPVLLTADTDTGAALARRLTRFAGVRPIDHRWTLAPLWADARPKAVVFVESAWWPALAALARRAGVPVVRVSAKQRRGRWLGRGWRFLGAPDAVLARDDAEAAWFRTWTAAETVGDLKAAGTAPANPLRWSRPFVVGGSTRPGDEAALLAALPEGVGLLLAPRHLDRLETLSLPGRWVRRTDLVDGVVPPDAHVWLDTHGELAGCYHGALAAFVGGTFDPAIGGHSPHEARRAGVPVVCGPHHHANTGFDDAVVAESEAQLGEALTQAIGRTTRPAVGDTAVRIAARLAPLVREEMAPPASPRPWARPLVPLWRGLTGARNRWFDRVGGVRVDVPVISVGSTNPRGPGKTSAARWVARQLATAGHRPGIAVRGYRRSRPGRDVRLSRRSPAAADLGDEGALLAREFLVAAGPDRVACARALVEAGCTVVVLDDGLQHRRLHRDLDLIVLDPRFREGRGLFPAGERRESAVVPRGATVLDLTRRPGPWRGPGPLRGPVAGFAGIARPADFLASLELEVARFRAFSDHHPFDESDAASLLSWADGLPLVCTAKDQVRLPPALRDRVFHRDIEVSGPVPDALAAFL